MIEYYTIIIGIVSLLIIWAIISVPVWISAKILTSGRARFGRAMLVTAAGPIVYTVVLLISTSISAAVESRLSLTLTVALVLAFLAWIYVFKRGFEPGWIRGGAIAILAIILFFIVGVAINSLTDLFVPNARPIITTGPTSINFWSSRWNCRVCSAMQIRSVEICMNFD
jgi:hypothetical protein